MIVKSEHFPGCSEADSTNTLAPGDLFSIETLAAVVAIAEQIPRCQSTYAVSLRSPWEMFTFHNHGTVGTSELKVEENRIWSQWAEPRGTRCGFSQPHRALDGVSES